MSTALEKAAIFLLEKHLMGLLQKKASYHSTMIAFKEAAITETAALAIQELQEEIEETEALLEAVRGCG